MKRGYALALVLACAAQSSAYITPRRVTPASMNRNTRELFQESMDLEEQFWDPAAKLVRHPTGSSEEPATERYMVRESTWYALGLLLRDRPGDRQRAAEAIDAALKQQFVTPGVPWYGTFRRTPEEPDPDMSSVMWRNYDPNWREFIGTTFAIILIEYPDRISPELSQRMYAAIDRAIEGEMHQGRLVPSYSNIALMYGFLWDFAAAHDNRDDWRRQSARWTEDVDQLFRKYDAFNEYNSPTYYGVDLYGLALWRDYGSTRHMQTMGEVMESTLWRDIASFYQPDLRNISGPYDRSYGMDMESYVSVVGVWMRTVLDAEKAPLPKITATTDHVADVWFAPLLAILGTRVPADASQKFRRFAGVHLLRKQITEDRIATAWIGRDVIYGGEATGRTKDAGTTTQFHPATVQWRTPSKEIGWVQLTHSPMIDVTADEHGLTISASGTIRLRIHARDLVPEKISATAWQLPGVNVTVDSDSKSFSIVRSENAIDVVYAGVTGMRLVIRTTHPH